MTIASLIVDVAANTSKLQTDVEKIHTQFDNLGSMAAKLGGVLAGAFTVTAITGAVSKVIDLADNLSNLSSKTGISTTGLQKLDLAFQGSGVSLDTVTANVTKLAKNLLGDDKSAVAAMTKLGLSVTDLKKMSPEDLFTTVADAVGKIQNPTEKAFAAMTIFGKGGAELLQGLDGHLKETTDKFEAMGLIIDEQTVKAADEFGDKLGLVGKQMLGILANAIGPMLPALSALASAFASVASVVGPVLGMAIKGVMIGLAGLWESIATFLAGLGDLAQKVPLVGKHLGGLTEASEWLRKSAASAGDMMASLAEGTDKTAVSAHAAAAPLIGVGDAVAAVGKHAKQSAYDLGGVEEAFKKIANEALKFDRENIAANAATSQELTRQQEVHAAAVIEQLTRTTAAQAEAAQLRRSIEFSAADYAIAQAQREHASKSDIVRMERELSLARLNASIADSEAEFQTSTMFIDKTGAEYIALADVHHLMVEKMTADWQASQAAMLNESHGFFEGVHSGFRSLVDGMTGKNGVAGFMENLGKGIVNGFGNIMSAGLTSVINMGVQLAVEGIKKIGNLIAGLFQSEETKKVNSPRDQFFAQFGGWDGLALKLTNTLIGQGVEDAGNVALGLMSAVNASKTESAFHDSEDAILAVFNASGQSFKKMAMGGSGTVSTPTWFLAGEAGPEDYSFSGANRRLGGGDASLAEEVRALRRELPRAIGVALADALALA